MTGVNAKPERVFLGFGSNLGHRKENIRRALEFLAGYALKIKSLSSFYLAEPVDYLDQPWFINAAAEIATRMTPDELLTACLQVEKELKRKRAVPKGPRTLDIDILLFGQRIIRQEALTIPHPRLTERMFMLLPLAEIAPSVNHPVEKAAMSELVKNSTSTKKVVKCGLVRNAAR